MNGQFCLSSLLSKMCIPRGSIVIRFPNLTRSLAFACSAPFAYANGAVIPMDDFVIVTGSDSSYIDLYKQFSIKGVSEENYVTAVNAINSTLAQEDIDLDLPFSKSLILTLPGRSTLARYSKYASTDSFDAVWEADNNTEFDNISLAGDSDTRDKNFSSSSLSLTDSYLDSNTASYSISYSEVGAAANSSFGNESGTWRGAEEVHEINSAESIEHGEELKGVKPHDELEISTNFLKKPNQKNEIIQSSVLDSLAYANLPLQGYNADILNESTEKPESQGFVADQQEKQKRHIKISQSETGSSRVRRSVGHEHDHVAVSGWTTLFLCITSDTHKNLIEALDESFAIDSAEQLSHTMKNQLAALLRNQGFIDAQIVRDTQQRIDFIQPGQSYRVTSIEIRPKNQTLLDTTDADASGNSEPMIARSLAVDEIYSDNFLTSARQLATDWLAENGYPLTGKIGHIINRDDGEATLNIAFEYETSAHVKIQKYALSGENVLAQRQLEKISPFTDNKEFSLTALNALRMRLMQTDYYENVEFELIEDENSAQEDWLLGISTKAKASKPLSTRVGYSQGREGVLETRFELKNMTGREDDLSFAANWDDLNKSVAAEYRNNNFYKYGIDQSYHLDIGVDNNLFYESKRKAVGLHIESPYSPLERNNFWSAGASFINLEEQRQDMSSEPLEYSYFNTSLYFGSKANNLSALEGWSIGADYYAGLNTQAESYLSIKSNLSGGFSPIKDTRLDWRVGLSSIWSQSLNAVPFSAHFYPGATDLNRGYEPFAYSSFAQNNERIAYQASSQIETKLDFLIKNPLISEFAPFVDATVVGGDQSGTPSRFFSVGIGFLGELTRFPFRVDVAFPVTDSDQNGPFINFRLGI